MCPPPPIRLPLVVSPLVRSPAACPPSPFALRCAFIAHRPLPASALVSFPAASRAVVAPAGCAPAVRENRQKSPHTACNTPRGPWPGAKALRNPHKPSNPLATASSFLQKKSLVHRQASKSTVGWACRPVFLQSLTRRSLAPVRAAQGAAFCAANVFVGESTNPPPPVPKRNRPFHRSVLESEVVRL